jgi:hypothetical protein
MWHNKLLLYTRTMYLICNLYGVNIVYIRYKHDIYTVYIYILNLRVIRPKITSQMLWLVSSAYFQVYA